jgi:hypothetical protein
MASPGHRLPSRIAEPIDGKDASSGLVWRVCLRKGYPYLNYRVPALCLDYCPFLKTLSS